MHEIKVKDNFIKITYDSSANEIYYFDIVSKRFFTPENIEGYEVSKSLFESVTIGDKYLISYSSVNNPFDNNIYIVYENGKPSDFGGIQKMYRCSKIFTEKNLCFIETLNKENVIYDGDNDMFITLRDYTGKKIETHNIYCPPSNQDKEIAWIGIDGFRYNNNMLYDFKNHCFLLNPSTKGYIFYKYSDVLYSGNFKIYSIPPINGQERQIIQIPYNDVIEFTSSYADKIGAAPSSQEEDTNRVIQNIKNGEINTVYPDGLAPSISYENKILSALDKKFIVENAMKLSDNKLSKNELLYIVNNIFHNTNKGE